MVTGEAREVTEPAALAELSTANIARWAPAGGGRVVAVSTTMISGRRIVRGAD